jgi:hypothetical protein
MACWAQRGILMIGDLRRISKTRPRSQASLSDRITHPHVVFMSIAWMRMIA